MILPSIGEEFGWAGIVCVFIVFLLYLHRAILIGRQTGTPFLFYLCTGIGIATFVQFLLIAGGSIGALPLSGVSLAICELWRVFNCHEFPRIRIFIVSVFSSRLTGTNEICYQDTGHNLMPALVAALLA